MSLFKTIDLSHLSSHNIILDIDGTLISDKGMYVDSDTASKITELSRKNSIWLFSNGPIERTKEIARQFGIGFIDSQRKPSIRSMNNIGFSKPLLVIGDKYSTDGILAIRLNADFQRVARVESMKDTWLTKLVYLFDDFVGTFFSIFKKFLPYVILMRPLHWIKNTLVLTPILFAGLITDWVYLGYGVWAFVVFSLSSSVVYVLNDVFDVETDRRHEIKRWRPVANGSVSNTEAYILASVLLLSSVSVCLWVIGEAFVVIVFYILINFFYSFYLKKVPFLELVLVSMFYVLRVLVGGYATGVHVSMWIALAVFTGSLILVTGKRYGEMFRDNNRSVLRHYTIKVLRIMLVFVCITTAFIYILYSILGHDNNLLPYSSIFVLAALLRLLFVVIHEPKKAEYPEILVFSDHIIFGLFVSWVVFMVYIFY